MERRADLAGAPVARVMSPTEHLDHGRDRGLVPLLSSHLIHSVPPAPRSRSCLPRSRAREQGVGMREHRVEASLVNNGGMGKRAPMDVSPRGSSLCCGGFAQHDGLSRLPDAGELRITEHCAAGPPSSRERPTTTAARRKRVARSRAGRAASSAAPRDMMPPASPSRTTRPASPYPTPWASVARGGGTPGERCCSERTKP